jgi:alpha-maltose-1-phosphate synthase
MRIAHILRKYYPAEWGGTETAVHRLLGGLRTHGAESVVYAPKRSERFERDPLREAGHQVIPFRTFVPVWGLSPERRKQLIAVGGNLMSFDLLWKLRRAPQLSVIHTHTLNRLGGIAATVARKRRLPLVVTIHGGVLDMPAAVKEQLLEPLRGGLEWGKIFGWILRSRQVLDRADAIITCNQTEAGLLREKYPDKLIVTQPHGVDAGIYTEDHRAAACDAYPEVRHALTLLVVGRIDPVKNQAWVLQQMPRALDRFPALHLVLAGACTDEAYGKAVKKEIRNLGLESRVTLTGGLPANDPRLIGLFQHARAVVVPSLSETFGLVILEAWAAGTAVISSRTSGALGLIRCSEEGRLFDLGQPEIFHACLDDMMGYPERARAIGLAGQKRVQKEFDSALLSGRVKLLYEELLGEP